MRTTYIVLLEVEYDAGSPPSDDLIDVALRLADLHTLTANIGKPARLRPAMIGLRIALKEDIECKRK